MNVHVPRARQGTGGFTLLEIVIVVTVLAILAGAAVPLASKAFQSKARAVTSAEQDELAEAITLYFTDVMAFPAGIDDLWIKPSGAAGWTGPYLPSTTTDRLSGDSDWSVDGWSRPYVLSVSGDVLTVTSAGADGSTATSDDVEIEIDVTHIRREQTLAALELINQAVQLYNGENLPDDPLPTNFTLLLEELVDEDLLPTTSGFQADAWGDAYVAVPPNQSPVVAIGSVNLGASAGNGGFAGGDDDDD